MRAFRFLIGRQEFPSGLEPVKVRFAVIACFLLIAVVFLPLFGLEAALLPAFILSCVAIFGNLIYLAWIVSNKWNRYRIYFAVSLDILLITIILHYLGGIESSFWWIYAIVLVTVALMHGLKFGLYAAACSIFLYSMLLIAESIGIIGHVDRGILNFPHIFKDTTYLYARVLSAGTLFLMTAVISGLLSERIRKSKDELEKSVSERTGELLLANEQLRNEMAERRRAEQMARQSEVKVRSLIDACADSILMTDTEGVFIDLNETVARRIGKRVEDLVGTNSYDTLPHSVAQGRRARAAEVVRTKKPVRFTDRREDKYFDIHIFPVLETDGEVERLAIYARDITTQKMTEDRLRESERKYRSLVDLTSDSVYELDKDFRYTYVSDRGRDISGRKPEDHIGKTPFDFMPEEEKEWAFTFIQDKLDPPRPVRGFENTLIGQDGRRVVVETSAVPIYDTQEEFAGYLCVDRDITERKRMEMELKEKEEHLRSIVETSRDGIAVFGTPQKLTFANPALVSMFRYADTDDIVGTQTNHLCSSESLSVLESLRKRLDAGEEIKETITLKARRKDGTTFDAEVKVGHFFKNEERLEVAVVRDVTDKKRIEHQLNQAAKMAAVGELATGVAHEINNPIASIDVHAGLVREAFEDVRDRIDDSCCTQINASIGTIEQEIERCHAITSSLLSFARMPHRDVKAFGINELLMKTTKMVSSMSLSDVKVDFKFDYDLPLYWGSPNLLQQVFVNLLRNALKATGTQGTIAVSTSLVDAKNIRIQVSDSGHGIPENIRERIFDPFFTTSPEGEGTGLGLSISYYIVKQMNGEISVESTPGQGTTFTVVLPVVESHVKR